MREREIKKEKRKTGKKSVYERDKKSSGMKEKKKKW